MASTFTYQHLNDPTNDIRLLHIQSKEPIICSTSVHILTEAPAYRAISYTWGDASPLQNITLDQQPFAAWPNCVLALSQAYQHLPTGSLLWMDAICINQQDNDEKSRQVEIMGRIFRQAEEVFVSVGEEYGDSGFLYRIATNLHAVQTDLHTAECTECHPYEHFGQPFVQCTYHARQSWADSLSTETWARLKAAYESFSERPYWRRLWILQETALARRIQVACGDRVEYMDVLTCLGDLYTSPVGELHPRGVPPWTLRSTAMKRHDHFGFVLARRGSQEWPNQRQDMASYSLMAFVNQLKRLHCADVRDRIYGLLDLVDWRGKSPPRPDYNIHPFNLALEVVAKCGTYHEMNTFAFPESVSALLAAMKLTPSSMQVAEVNSMLETLPIDWNRRTATFDEESEQSCCCAESSSPGVGLMSFQSPSRWAVLRRTDSESEASMSEQSTPQATSSLVRHVSSSNSSVEERQQHLQQEPIFIDGISETAPIAESQVDSPKFDSPKFDRHDYRARKEAARHDAQRLLLASGLREEDVVISFGFPRADVSLNPVSQAVEFCPVLRPRNNQYYEILPRLVEVRSDIFFSNGDVYPPPYYLDQWDLWLCLDLEDAAIIALAHDACEAVAWHESSNELIVLNTNLCGQRASSFGFWSPHVELDPPEMLAGVPILGGPADAPPTIAGVPSVDDRFIICARCGGLFEPRLFESR